MFKTVPMHSFAPVPANASAPPVASSAPPTPVPARRLQFGAEVVPEPRDTASPWPIGDLNSQIWAAFDLPKPGDLEWSDVREFFTQR